MQWRHRRYLQILFDLDRNYEEIKKTLSLVDDNMKESINMEKELEY